MNRGQHRCLHHPRIRQCHKVIVAVNQVELRSVLENLRDMQVFGYFRIDRTILFIAPVDHCMQMGAGDRVARWRRGSHPIPARPGHRRCCRPPFPRRHIGAVASARRPATG